MKVLLDTNILIAALIAKGTCADLLEHCVLNHELFSSELLIAELRDKLRTKFKFNERDADEASGLMRSQMAIVVPRPLKKPVCRDPDDDVVLATAVSGSVDCIVTGDKDLLTLKQFQDVPIVSPREFADFEAGMEE